jgi:hypothetical protein
MPPGDLTSISTANEDTVERFFANATKLAETFVRLDDDIYRNEGRLSEVEELVWRLVVGRLAFRCLCLHYDLRHLEEQLVTELKMSPQVLGELLQEKPQLWDRAKKSCREWLLLTDRDLWKDWENRGMPEGRWRAWGSAIVQYINSVPSKDGLAKVLTIDNGAWLEPSQTLQDDNFMESLV